MNGYKLILVGSSIIQVIHDSGMITVKPVLKHRIEKANAFDPTIIHRRFPYHEDEFTLEGPCSPEKYHELIAFLNTDGALYLLYESAGVIMQYRIEVSALPSCPDDLHEHPDMISYTVVSRYINYDPVIDEEIQTLTEFDETITLGD